MNKEDPEGSSSEQPFLQPAGEELAAASPRDDGPTPISPLKNGPKTAQEGKDGPRPRRRQVPTMAIILVSQVLLIGSMFLAVWLMPRSVGTYDPAPSSPLTMKPAVRPINDGDLNDGNDTKVVYIIRHGEKIWMPSNESAYMYACESEQGRARAEHISSVFGTPPKQGFRTVDALFSFNYYNDDDCRTARGLYRTQRTITPLGQILGLDINNQTGSDPDLCGLELGSHVTDNCHLPLAGSADNFGPCCNSAAAAAIKASLFNGDAETKAVLVCWDHSNIVHLVSALAGSEVDAQIHWPASEFDKVVVIYFDAVTGENMRLDEGLYQGFQHSPGPGEKPGVNLRPR